MCLESSVTFVPLSLTFVKLFGCNKIIRIHKIYVIGIHKIQCHQCYYERPEGKTGGSKSLGHTSGAGKLPKGGSDGEAVR